VSSLGTGNDRYELAWAVGGSVAARIQSAALFRDPSAWYHAVIVADTTNAEESERIRLYINGTRITSFYAAATMPTKDYALPYWNQSAATYYRIGSYPPSAAYNMDGNLAEVIHVDGQALDPSYFGEFVAGVWLPKRYTGSYGSNGFYLDFTDASGANTLGSDRSGNGNNWTCNNISLVDGITYDSSVDTPTNNYCTMNSLDKNAYGVIYHAGSFFDTSTAGVYAEGRGTIAVNSGKWYYEVTPIAPSGSAGAFAGFGNQATPLAYPSSLPDGLYYNAANTAVYANGVVQYTGVIPSGTDVFGLALDYDNNTFQVFKNGSSLAPAATAACTGSIFVAPKCWVLRNSGTNGWYTNFGQRPFKYSPPTGFKALCTANLQPLIAPTVSGTFTGNLNTNGPFVWCGGVPTTLTINGNAVTFGTHVNRTAGGFKLITASSSYNASGSNAWTATFASPSTNSAFAVPQPAQGNP
jgi:hypothetical protein